MSKRIAARGPLSFPLLLLSLPADVELIVRKYLKFGSDQIESNRITHHHTHPHPYGCVMSHISMKSSGTSVTCMGCSVTKSGTLSADTRNTSGTAEVLMLRTLPLLSSAPRYPGSYCRYCPGSALVQYPGFTESGCPPPTPLMVESYKAGKVRTVLGSAGSESSGLVSTASEGAGETAPLP